MVSERLSWHMTRSNYASCRLSSCQTRILWTHKEVDLAPHPALDLILKVGDAEKFPQALCFESLDPFFQSQQAGSKFPRHRGGQRWQETRKTWSWTCSQSWWCCTARSCLIWPLLPLLRQSWCRFLLTRYPPCRIVPTPRYLKPVTSCNF